MTTGNLQPLNKVYPLLTPDEIPLLFATAIMQAPKGKPLEVGKDYYFLGRVWTILAEKHPYYYAKPHTTQVAYVAELGEYGLRMYEGHNVTKLSKEWARQGLGLDYNILKSGYEVPGNDGTMYTIKSIKRPYYEASGPNGERFVLCHEPGKNYLSQTIYDPDQTFGKPRFS